MPRARLALLVAIGALLSSHPARAVAVAVIRRPNASPAVAETVVRIQGELLSIGVEVEVIDAAERRSIRGLPGGAAAVIDVVGGAVPDAVDIWIDGEAPRRLVLTRAAAEPDPTNPSERVAIRAIEVLRSCLFEIDLAARKAHHGSASPRALAAPPAASAAVSRAPPPIDVLAEQRAGQHAVASTSEDAGDLDRARAGVELGAASLAGLDGVGVAVLPLVRLNVAVPPKLTVQATLAGFGSRPTVTAADSSARVAQQFGTLGVSHSFRAGSAVRPSLSLGAGALHTSMDGRATAPRQGHALVQWSFLFDVGAGLEVWLARRYSVSLAAHLQVAEPYVVMHFADSVVATSGRPNLLFVLAAGAWPWP